MSNSDDEDVYKEDAYENEKETEQAKVIATKEYILKLPASADLSVSVLDAYDRPLLDSRKDHPSEIKLSQGLYTVRIERNRLMKEEVVRLFSDTDLSGLELEKFSATPVLNSALSHEYYANSASRISKYKTRITPLAPIEINSKASLFIFLRAIDENSEHINESLAESLSLIDEKGYLVSNFTRYEVEEDKQKGWLAFSVDAPSGLYRLVSNQKPRREIPIYLFTDFQTQVFIVYKEKLLFKSMRVLMSQIDMGFNPYSSELNILDTAIEGFVNKALRLPKEAENLLVNSKFKNPILGIIGAYTIVRRLNNENTEFLGNELTELDKILENLGKVIPNAPDWQALCLMRDAISHNSLGSAIPMTFTAPPMFRIGLNAIIKACLDGKAIIKKNSLLEKVSIRQFSDSPSVSWQAFPKKGYSKTYALFMQQFEEDTIIKPNVSGYLDNLNDLLTQKFIANLPSNQTYKQSKNEIINVLPRYSKITLNEIKKTIKPNWVQAAFLNTLQQQFLLSNRAQGDIKESASLVTEVARQVGTTIHKIESEIKKLDRFSLEERHQLLGSEWSELQSAVDKIDDTDSDFTFSSFL